MQTTKSATTAGLLGIFLGSFGAHDWYLGRKKLGLVHVILFAAGFLLMLIGVFAEIFTVDTTYTYYRYVTEEPAAWTVALTLIGTLIILGNSIWGFIEGIIILAQGDAVLAAKQQALAASAGAATTTPVAAHSTTATPKSAPQTSSAAKSASAKPGSSTPVAPKPPKSHKKAIIGALIATGAIIVVAVVCIVIVLATRVDYSESYHAVRDLRTHINKIASNSDCENVVDYADSSWLSEKAYDKYIDGCKKTTNRDDELVQRLGDTAAVRKDSAISKQFDKFKTAYDAAIPNEADLTEKLDLYRAWHKFVILSDDLTTKSSEKDFQSAIEPLKNSGNDTLKSYGEGWLEHALAYRSAYNAYWDNSKAGNTEREAMDKAEDAFEDWMDDNAVDMTKVAELDTADTDDLRTEFEDLYDLIVEAYEENYDYDSGDCTEFFDSIYCD